MNINKKMLLKIILLIICIALVIFLGFVGYRYSIFSKLYNNNVKEELGNNYRITTLLNGEILYTSYYKDGVEMIIWENDGFFVWDNGNEAYTIYYDEGKYEPIEPIGESFVNVSESGYGFGSLFNLTYLKSNIILRSFNIIRENIRTGELDGKEYYIIKSDPKHAMSTSTLWIDKETFFVRKSEVMVSSDYYDGSDTSSLYPRTLEFIVEKNIVTENDVAKPHLENYNLID